MLELSRRTFLKLGGQLAAMMGLSATLIPRIADALEQLARSTPVLWLQGQSCSGCSVSLLNATPLSPDRLLTEYISMVFHQTLSTATGHTAVAVLNKAIESGGYILAVEGAIPAGMPEACTFAEEPFAKQVARAARNAKAVIAVGACAAFGGIPAAEGNPTGAMSAPDYLKQEGIATPVIRLPGCPAHPDWVVGTVVHVLKFGLPPMDGLARPRMFYDRILHDQCQRYADYERERFAGTFGEPGCLFKLGCQGPLTHADCNNRLWNAGTNTCIRAGAPCVGCASPKFAAKADFPFFRKNGRMEPKPS